MHLRAAMCAAAFATLAALACSDPTGARSELLDANALMGVVKLQNLTNEPVFYMLVEREHAALIEWIICSDPAPGEHGCARVPPRSTKLVPYAAIPGYTSRAEESIVYHWRLVPDAASPTGYRADQFRSLVVRLR